MCQPLILGKVVLIIECLCSLWHIECEGFLPEFHSKTGRVQQLKLSDKRIVWLLWIQHVSSLRLCSCPGSLSGSLIYLSSCSLPQRSAFSFLKSMQANSGGCPALGLGWGAQCAHLSLGGLIKHALHGVFKQSRYEADGIFSVLTTFRDIDVQVSPSRSILKIFKLV